MTAPTLPQAAPKWTHAPEDVLRLTEEAIAEDKATEDRIAALKPEECTFESVFLALAHAEAKRRTVCEPLAFYQNVSPSQELRDASSKSDVMVQDHRVDASMRLDVFRAKLAAQKNIKESGRQLDPEEQRLVDKEILAGTRAGLALPDAEREKLTLLKKELSQACSDFKRNCNEAKGIISFTLEELKGVPADSVSGYNKRAEGGKELYDVTFKMPDWGPVTRWCEIPETRRKAYEAFEDRLAINASILSRIFDLRREIAHLLGYASWADYITEVKMVKTAKAVEEFLSELEQKLRPVGLKDREALLALKKREHESKGLPFDGELYVWDYSYYDRKFLEEHLSLDTKALREHFPVDVVVPAILDIYKQLFEVEFVEVEAETWHPDVQAYALWEKDAKDESDFIGYCYVDIYPRESKYSGTAVWPLIPGYTHPDGVTRHHPSAAIVANLAKPPARPEDKPALMGHFDTVLFFHEFGHVFHELLSRTRFARFHGTSVALDFAEAPSQMLENWCYEPTILKRMSSHYETGRPLDDEFIGKILKSRNANVGMFNLRQVSYAVFDLKAHLFQEPADYTKLWCDLRESIGLLKSGDKPLPGQAAFQHLVGDYSVGYYGYTYSLVFAADMYATVFKADPLDPARGRHYRETVLVPGSSKDEMDLLKDLLGREPNSEAFVRQLFGSSA
ncbi:Metalloprotease [Pilatotrama ljubarskyi]|nr:Metalloprotease [Pilatotrama ljubarskyi]